MAERVTACPHCGTTFRVTETQLQSARGAVRCGSCLHIFKASDHFVDQETNKVVEHHTPGKEQRSPLEEKLPEDEFLERELEGELELIDADLEELLLEGEDLNDLVLPEDQESLHEDNATTEPDYNVIDQTENDEEDELISDDLLLVEDTANSEIVFDDDINPELLRTTKPGYQVPDTFPTDGESATQESDNPNEKADEAWAMDLLEELSNEEEEENERQKPNPEHGFAATTDAQTQTLNEPTSEATEPMQRDYSDFQSGRTEPPIFSEKQRLISAIPTDALELEYHQVQRTWPKRLLWSLLCLLATIGLIAQYAWYEFDQLSRDQRWRPAYALACQYANCTLPAQIDRGKINAYNLVVRSHPRAKGALIIDVILLNAAKFEQTYPHFSLTFSDITGTLIAQRTFGPDQYLGGELKDSEIMPIGRPIHITLEILDPGPEAVNYEVNIVPQHSASTETD